MHLDIIRKLAAKAINAALTISKLSGFGVIGQHLLKLLHAANEGYFITNVIALHDLKYSKQF